MKAKIKIERNNFLFRYECYFCGGVIDKEEIRVKVYPAKKGGRTLTPDKNPMVNVFNFGKKGFHVCWDCAKGGPSKMKEGLIKQGEYFRNQAKECDELANHLEIECPSWKRIQTEVKMIEKELKAYHREYEKESKKFNNQGDIPF